MRWFDHSSPLPEENLALDQLLLDDAESGASGEALRIWESPVPFVVLGVGQKYRDEVHVDACRSDGVPILRRCSAGGCVLQGPGSLNYTLVLDTRARAEMRGLHDSYCAILNRLRDAFHGHGVKVDHAGISDLAIAGRKISGNAQRRRKRFFLHHGTLLNGLDASRIGRYLKEPVERPDYRNDRVHDGFVTNLDFSRDALVGIVRQAFDADEPDAGLSANLLERTAVLAAEKYRDDTWTYRR